MKRRWPWIAGAVVVAAGVVVGILTVRARAEADRRWKAFVARHEERLGRLGTGVRPTLASPPGERGNAWDAYGNVLAAIDAMPVPQREALDVQLTGRGEPKPDLARQALADHAKLLEQLREAARRPRAHLLPLGGIPMPRASAPKHAAMLLALSARERAAAGDVDGAIDECAVALQMARDVAAAGHYSVIGALDALETTVNEIVRLLHGPRTPPPQIERLERLLADADAHLPTPSSLADRELVFIGDFLRQIERGTMPAPRTWFSRPSRATLAQVGEQSEQLTETYRSAENLPWPESKSRVEAARRDIDRNPSSLTNWIIPRVDVAWSILDACARLRTARAAAMLRRGLDPDVHDWPRDPYADGPIRRDGATLRSAWWNGRPDARGAWMSPGRDEDLVLELPK